MKTQNGPSVKRKYFRTLLVMIFIVMFGYIMEHTFHTYKNIGVVPLEAAFVEVGSEEFDLQSLIKEINGNIVSIKKNVDTSVIGEQEVILEMRKEKIVKEVPVTISVKDTQAPIITLKEENITITQGDEYSVGDNIESIVDSNDGDLEFNDQANQSHLNSFNMKLDGSLEDVGDHTVTIHAIDNSGNVSTQVFTVTVVEPEPEPEPEPAYYYQPVYYNLPPNAAGNDLVSIAYSYLGYPYGPGNYPGAFDCSGFVQFVYSQVGINISRSTWTQLYDGYPVSFEEMQPGDIIIWGYGWDSPTHSAMYVGNGQMIHSANYDTGVIVSDVGFWLNGSGTSIISIRRI